MADLVITVTINDDNQAILLHDLLDINDWVQKAVVGKINNCTKRMAREATEVLKADDSVSSMPATNVDLCKALIARDGYKNRAARDAARGA
tara:strand:- start:8 stop:280 length:273 start_codon:yes stop_codon:yes gene_type:complete